MVACYSAFSHDLEYSIFQSTLSIAQDSAFVKGEITLFGRNHLFWRDLPANRICNDRPICFIVIIAGTLFLRSSSGQRSTHRVTFGRRDEEK